MQQRLKGHRVEVTGTSRESAYGKCGFGLAPSLGIFTNCVRTARFGVFCYHLAEENVACSKESSHHMFSVSVGLVPSIL